MLQTPDHATLLQRISQTHPDPSLQRRARLLLLYAEGRETAAVAEAVGLSPSTARRWRRRYLDGGLEAVFSAEVLAALPAEAPARPAPEPATAPTPAAPPRSDDAPAPIEARIRALFDDVAEAFGGKKKLKALRKRKPAKALRKLGKRLSKYRDRVRKRLSQDGLSARQRRRLVKQRKAIKRFLKRTRALLDELS